MYKYIFLCCLIFTNVAYASDNEMVFEDKLKNVNILSANGVVTICHVKPKPNLYSATGFEYAWDYFIFKKLSVGLSYNWIAFDAYQSLSLFNNVYNRSLSTLGLRTGYYFGSKKSIVIPNVAIEGRVSVGRNTYETGGLMLNYSAGTLIKLRKNVYIDFAGSKMYSKNYFYNIVKLGLSSMIY